MKSDETENAPTIELTRRRALAGLATIGVGSAAAGAGTFAAFSGNDSASGGFTAGTLTLTTGETSLDFSAGNMEPGDSGSSSVTLNAGGTLAGEANLTPELASVTSEAGDAGSNNEGDLEDNLEFELWLDAPEGNNGTYDSNDDDVGLRSGGANGGATTGSPSLDLVSNYQNNTWNDAIENMSTDKNWTFHVDWELPDTTGNKAQGDTLNATFNFTLK